MAHLSMGRGEFRLRLKLPTMLTKAEANPPSFDQYGMLQSIWTLGRGDFGSKAKLTSSTEVKPPVHLMNKTC